MKRLITTMLTACLLCSCAPRTAAPQDMDTGLERSVMPDRLAASSPAVSSAPARAVRAAVCSVVGGME